MSFFHKKKCHKMFGPPLDKKKKKICVFTVTCQKNLGSVGRSALLFFFFFYNYR